VISSPERWEGPSVWLEDSDEGCHDATQGDVDENAEEYKAIEHHLFLFYIFFLSFRHAVYVFQTT